MRDSVRKKQMLDRFEREISLIKISRSFKLIRPL